MPSILSAPQTWLSRSTQALSRSAHTYSRQDRGLYAKTHLQFGNNVSESHRKTLRRWLPNVHSHTMYSPTLERKIKLNVVASVWRTIQNKYNGNLDAYLTQGGKRIQRDMGTRAEEIRDEILFIQHARKLGQMHERELAKTKAETEPATETNESTESNASSNVVTEKEIDEAKTEGLATGM